MSNLMYFLSSGKYKNLHILDKQLKVLRGEIRHYQETIGEQRIEWAEPGVVGKFSNFRKYNYDEVGLKEFLDERGLLPLVSTVKWNDLSVDEQEILGGNKLKIREVLKFIPNAELRTKKDENEDFKNKICNMNIDDLVWLWTEKKYEYKSLSKLWNWICLNSPNVDSDPDQYKIFGTVLYKRVDPIIDAVQAFKSLGNRTFVKLCRVQEELVNLYGLKGYFSLKEIRMFKSLADIQTRYYLMELHEETRVREMLENKQVGYLLISQLEAKGGYLD